MSSATRGRWAVLLDVLAVLLFVLVGRHTHGEGEGAVGVLRTLWPFLAGLAAGWVAVLRLGWPGPNLGSGLLVGLAAAWLGLVLRAVSGQGVAADFAVVATVFLVLFLVAWRALGRAVRTAGARILHR